MGEAEDYPPVLDTGQVAELLGITIAYVRQLTKEGKIPAYRLPDGRTYRYFKNDIYDVLRSNPVHASDADTGAKGQQTSSKPEK